MCAQVPCWEGDFLVLMIDATEQRLVPVTFKVVCVVLFAVCGVVLVVLFGLGFF